MSSRTVRKHKNLAWAPLMLFSSFLHFIRRWLFAGIVALTTTVIIFNRSYSKEISILRQNDVFKTAFFTKDPLKIKSRDQGIPKIIHQIWNDDVIPEAFHDNIRGLVAHNNHPRWTYYFWTLKLGTKLIEKEFPRLLARFSKAANLLKADILRLVVLYRYGGVYFDLDTVSVKPLDPYVESHNCSLTTDPEEHVIHPNRPKPTLLITNSAILCKPNNWFLAHLIEQLANQSARCRAPIKCTGPGFVSMNYGRLLGTNRSKDLPIVDNYRYFEDMVDVIRHKDLNNLCGKRFHEIKYEWARDICRNWIKRGRENRTISDKAYTYHTWFHTYMYPNKTRAGISRKITKIVDNVTFYQG